MTDSHPLPGWLEAQSKGAVAWFRSAFLNRVLTPSRQELARLQQAGCRYAVLDALTEHHLEIQGEALRDALCW